MDNTERRTAKRSRFDQTEPEPKRPSRFDRRSRSPPSKRSEGTRSRSPVASSKPPSEDPTAAAAAAAARINAQLQARKGIQHVDVPPIMSTMSPDSKSAPAPGTTKEGGTINGEMYVSDGDYIKDIEVNDLRNRYLLTRSTTQKQIKEETGADITTRGSYLPDKSMATPTNPPLYLHITSLSKEGLEKAVAKIEELMKQELPNLVDERRFRRPREQQEPVERDEFGRRKWPEEKIPIGLEPIPGFNLRAQVVGGGGAFVKHIQHETGCRVQIKGRGSGYLEAATNRESDEDMFLHVAGPEPDMVQKAKELCEDLVENVKEHYESFKNRPPRAYGGGDRGGYGDHRGHGGHGGYGGRHGGGSGGGGGDSYHPQDNYGRSGGYQNRNGGGGRARSGSPAAASSGPGATQSPTSATAQGGVQNTADAYQAYYQQYYGGQDPYAAYGGYAAYVQYYQYYQNAAAQAQTQQGSPTAAGATTSTSPLPPPPSDAAPPPPSAAPPPPPSGAPPGASGSGSYAAMPPSPGL